MENKYKNPSALCLISKYIKNQNIKLLDNYAKDNNLTNTELIKLKKKYLKLNYIYPTVIQSKSKEYLQTFIIKDIKK
tara:strand:+ start:108 stop:338 length:231 start_codon:yes stop_codon:yes gene_type:complete